MTSGLIEAATLDDIPQLGELLALLFTQEAEFQPDPQKQSEGLRQIIARPEVGTILVFREGTKIAGMVNLLYTVSTACGGRVALLEDMIVRPDKRGVTIGARLMQAAIDHAQSSGCARITLLTDRHNLDAIRFYQRLGFSESAMIPLRLAL